MAQGVAARLGAVRHAELAIDVREVELHRLLGDPQLLADLRVREALGDVLQDLELALGDQALGAGLDVERSDEGAPALVKTVPSTVWRMAEASSPGSIDLTM